MEKNKLLNRRFIYKTTTDLIEYLRIIEDVDLLINESMQLDPLSENCVIYGESVQEFLVGREVVGNDPNVKFHETIKIKDFSEVEGEKIVSPFSTKEELFELLKTNLKHFSNYRLSFVTLDEVELFFFNLEK